MRDHLPVLQVVVPLIAAPLCVLLRRRLPALAVATTAAWAALVIAVLQLQGVAAHGPVSYPLGDWAAPWGIEYRVDLLSGFVAVFVAGIGALVMSYAPRSLLRELPAERLHLFLAAYLLALAGLLGITVTGDLFNVFVFLEISSLSSYAMISLGPDRRALTATLNYLMLGTIGATFILIGIGLMFQMTGTLNMADMASRLGPVMGTRTIHAAFGFLSVGIALKMALFPLHGWLPNAYAYAPSVVTAFLAATSTKVSVYLLLRFVFTVFGGGFALGEMPLETILLPLSLIGIFVASTVAIFQRDVKRLLAYSSIAQVGYMVLGASLATTAGLTGGIVHLFNHALTKGGMFLALGCIALRLDAVGIDDLRGIGRRMPLTTFAWVLGGLSLIGVPLTAGFVTKVWLLRAVLEKGWWPVAALVLLSSLLAVVYVWRVVETAYFREPPPGAEPIAEAPLSMLLPTWALIGAAIWFGVDTTWSAQIARRAAESLLGGAP